jgi:hypothetical protein
LSKRDENINASRNFIAKGSQINTLLEFDEKMKVVQIFYD